MKIIAATRILDEADIVEAFIRHSAHFVSHHILIDNGSNDGTVEILKKLAEEGFGITVYQNRSIHYSERSFNTFMYRKAIEEFGADWIVFLDADEFLDDRKLGTGLGPYLQNLSTSQPNLIAVKIPMVNYNYTRQDNKEEIIVPQRTTKRQEPTTSYKIIARAMPDLSMITIDNGSHDVLIDGVQTDKSIIENNLWLAHYSERHPLQIVAKFFKGWAKVLAAGQTQVDSGVSWHYKGPFYMILQDPATLLRNEWFMTRKNESPDLIEDPIAYKGGALKYTAVPETEMIVAKSLAGYIHDIAVQHGRLMEESPDARRLVDEWASQQVKII
ncbi:glycosyltransferase family 2 protein [Methylobacterium oryzihabitans]|uniref:Glycosyltransferase family 2 protein n=1 Tax=Methylobacterium oryzihabitans TaxID=2499852 RepID=A0A437P1J3_9HYPH|nr:glycosyltransferase family 2 protein [Methylobacterium oryzihabitans]RVU16122.1 glycosyltransferase family 2 protein [Methylobacterium oryzihabitans]